jgi:DNA repair photolyase
MSCSTRSPIKGRGALTNQPGRFEGYVHEAFDDGWQIEEEQTRLETVLTADATRTIITRNDSPDISFDQSINPYRGCEHGCVYCFARPTHAYLGMSPGLDFESRLFYKPEAASLLERELRAKTYKVSPIALGTNTDPYQPAERGLKLTRGILEVLQRFAHPVTIVTKSALVTRDIDILAEMASRNLARVAISVTTLNPDLARVMEPRAATPQRRLAALRELHHAGIPTVIMTAPMIPAINDHELDGLLEAGAAAGARHAGMVLIRLPLEIEDLFRKWLRSHFPDRAERVLSLVRQCRGGKYYRADWGTRMKGEGPYAELLGQRFHAACRRHGLNIDRAPLDTRQFRAPPRPGDQMALF